MMSGQEKAPIQSTLSDQWDTLQLTSDFVPQDEVARYAHILRSLDRDPSHLLNSLEVQRAHYPRVRLGVYFEHLTTYWLSHLVEAQPLYREVQIREPQTRGFKTLGALDLVAQVHQNQSDWIHIEVATKFYLEREEAHLIFTRTSDLDSRLDEDSWVDHPWIDQLVGPNERDSLGTKLRRLLSHQLPLSGHARAREMLGEMGVAEIKKRVLWLKGRLFRWAGHDLEHTMLPLWLRSGDLEMLSKYFGNRFKAVYCAKPSWLAPPTVSDLELVSLVSPSGLETHSRSARGERGATLWYCASSDLTVRRWVMIVPDDWCNRSSSSIS